MLHTTMLHNKPKNNNYNGRKYLMLANKRLMFLDHVGTKYLGR